jgi:hypothetical protein
MILLADAWALNILTADVFTACLLLSILHIGAPPFITSVGRCFLCNDITADTAGIVPFL